MVFSMQVSAAPDSNPQQFLIPVSSQEPASTAVVSAYCNFFWLF